MSEPVLTLEYEITVDNLRAYMRRISRGIRYRVHQLSRFFAGMYVLWIGAGAWRDGNVWVAAFCLSGGLFLTLSEYLFRWWMLRLVARTEPTATIRLEFDDRSLLVRNCAQMFGNRLWWSRLTKCEERSGEIELSFDGESYPSMSIPDRAFANDAQRMVFHSLINQHLPKPVISQPA